MMSDTKHSKTEGDASNPRLEVALEAIAQLYVFANQIAISSFDVVQGEPKEGDFHLRSKYDESFSYYRPDEQQTELAEALREMILFSGEATHLHKSLGFPASDDEAQLVAKLVNLGKYLGKCEVLIDDGHVLKSSERAMKAAAAAKANKKFKEMYFPALRKLSELQSQGMSKRGAIAKVSKEWGISQATLWNWDREQRGRPSLNFQQRLEEISNKCERLFNEIVDREQQLAETYVDLVNHTCGLFEFEPEQWEALKREAGKHLVTTPNKPAEGAPADEN